MSVRKLPLWVVAVIVAAAGARLAWALGEQLGLSADQLELKYDLDCAVHRSGRVSVLLTVVDPGKIKPIDDIQLTIPSDDGSSYVDLSVSLAVENSDGKLRARAHMNRELAERATIRLVTHTNPNTKTHSPRSWYYHVIPIAEHLNDGDQKAN